MPATITTALPAFLLTVRDAYYYFVASWAGSVPTYEADIKQLPVLKSIKISPESSEKKIYASGLVYAMTNHVSGAELGVNAVALPPAFTRKAAGSVEGANKGLAYSISDPTRVEFAFGAVSEKSDGTFKYYLFPRCVLTPPDTTDETSEDDDPDPSEEYTITALPTSEKIWKIEYDTGLVDVTKVPLTPTAFYTAQPYTIANLVTLGASEAAVSGG